MESERCGRRRSPWPPGPPRDARTAQAQRPQGAPATPGAGPAQTPTPPPPTNKQQNSLYFYCNAATGDTLISNGKFKTIYVAPPLANGGSVKTARKLALSWHRAQA